jgi:AraC-like DNA-binding protein
MLVLRVPRPALRPFVKTLWVAAENTFTGGADRELVLPTGTVHLVFRLDEPLRLFESLDDPHGRTVDYSIVGGARAAYYIRDISKPMHSVGAQLQPGAAELLGAPAGELAGCHTPLEELWGREARVVRERLLEAALPDRQLDVFESVLASRLPRVRGVHPAVALALERFEATAQIREIVHESGYSHRQFIAVFRQAVGLTPKLYGRVLRFQAALARTAAEPGASWVDLALAAGYSDQSHFNREFREFAGIPPGEYRKLSPARPHHVPVAGGA